MMFQGTLFPSGTPNVILNMCGDSILKEMQRKRKQLPYTAQELDRHVCWKEGVVPTPNLNLDLQSYSIENHNFHAEQIWPLPVRESCPGAASAEERREQEKGTSDFPQGIPEVCVTVLTLSCLSVGWVGIIWNMDRHYGMSLWSVMCLLLRVGVGIIYNGNVIVVCVVCC